MRGFRIARRQVPLWIGVRLDPAEVRRLDQRVEKRRDPFAKRPSHDRSREVTQPPWTGPETFPEKSPTS